MADAFVQVPPPSSGTKVAGQTRTRGSDTVFFQEIIEAYPADCVSIGANVTTTSSQLLAANPIRRALWLQNISDTWIYVRFDAAPVATATAEVGIAIGPNGGGAAMERFIDQGALNAIHAGTGNKRLLITEWSG
jgi:hypothetical protein